MLFVILKVIGQEGVRAVRKLGDALGTDQMYVRSGNGDLFLAVIILINFVKNVI